VDPYYLTFKAEALGYHPEMILAGRRINDGMGKYIAEKTVKLLIKQGKAVKGAKVAVLGITFKENVPDLRNTRVVDIVRELEDYGVEVLVHDPLADAQEALQYYGLEIVPMEALAGVDAVVVSVLHTAYLRLGLDGVAKLCTNGSPIVVDVKGAFDPQQAKSEHITCYQL
jgi:UDP-N-acetyl-D-galactosamine dehydrogenase